MIKTLIKSLREHKKGSLITIILSASEVVFEIVIPLCMSGLIDYGIDTGTMAKVWTYGAALFIFALLQLTTGIGAARIGFQPSAIPTTSSCWTAAGLSNGAATTN